MKKNGFKPFYKREVSTIRKKHIFPHFIVFRKTQLFIATAGGSNPAGSYHIGEI